MYKIIFNNLNFCVIMKKLIFQNVLFIFFSFLYFQTLAQVNEQIPSNFLMVYDDDKFVNNSTPVDCNTEDANSCPWNNQPIKYIGVNFHFFCKPNGKGGFNENNDGDTPSSNSTNAYTRAEAILKEANEQLRENSPGKNAPPGTSVCKINLQLSLKGVYIHRGNFASDTVKLDTTTGKSYANTQNSSTDIVSQPSYYVNGDSEINCFFYPIVAASNVKVDAFVSGYTSYGGNYIVVSGGWENYKKIYKDNANSDTWYLKIDAKTLLHEIFHTFGLNHPKDIDNCDDTKDGLTCWQYVKDESNKCHFEINLTNNLMDYNGDVNTWSLSPCQICIAQQSMEGTGVYDMKKYIPFVGTCQKPVALLYGSPTYCIPSLSPSGYKPSIIVNGSATTYETSYRLTIVEINPTTSQEIASTKKTQWFMGEIGKIDLAKTFNYVFRVNSTYKITLRVENSCSEPDIINKIINITDCNETTIVQNNDEWIKRVLIYPNPAAETISIEYDLGGTQNTKIDLINLVTEVSYPLKARNSEDRGIHYLTVNLPSDIVDGNYLVKISTDNRVITKSIFIQH